jgi:hypothetical protein
VLISECFQQHAGVVIGKLVKIQHGPATVSAEDSLFQTRSEATVRHKDGKVEQNPMKRKSGDRPA